MKYRSVASILALSLAGGAAWAQTTPPAYPSKPVRLIVPFAAGGPADAGARTIAQKLSDVSPMTLVIENRAGAGGTIGADVVAKSPSDGYTLLLGSPGPLSIAPSLYPKLPYDPLRSFAPVINAISSDFVVVVHPSVPARSVKELVALAKARPEQLHFGSAGNGSVLHLAGELFNASAGVNIAHVPYKGGGPAMINLLGGQVELMIVDIPHALPHVNAGKLRALAVTGRSRTTLLRNLPTVDEAGAPGYQVATWSGILAPAGTSADIVNRVYADFAKALASPDLKERFTQQAVEVVAMRPEAFAALVRDETAKWAKVVKAAKVKLD
jgi:tripartite-type tricarboxylate transporter receptor subunit TctC